MQKVTLMLFLSIVIITTTVKVKANDSIIDSKIFFDIYEKENLVVGNYTQLFVNNSKFSFDYYVLEKQEKIAVNDLQQLETCYFSFMHVTNVSNEWVKGDIYLKTKVRGERLNHFSSTFTIDSREVSTTSLTNVNVTIENNYRIKDLILWIEVTVGIVDVFWSNLAKINYYVYEEFFHESEKTSIVEQIGDNWCFVTAFILGLPFGIIFDLKSKKYLNKIGS